MLVLDIIKGKAKVGEVSRQFDLPLSEIVDGVAQGKAGMENALRMSASGMRSSSKRCRKPTVRRCWSYVPEIKLASLLGKDEP